MFGATSLDPVEIIIIGDSHLPCYRQARPITASGWIDWSRPHAVTADTADAYECVRHTDRWGIPIHYGTAAIAIPSPVWRHQRYNRVLHLSAIWRWKRSQFSCPEGGPKLITYARIARNDRTSPQKLFRQAIEQWGTSFVCL